MRKFENSTKRPVGRPEVDSEPVSVRIERKIIMALDNARRDTDDLPTRPEMVRRVLTDWLRAKGYLK